MPYSTSSYSSDTQLSDDSSAPALDSKGGQPRKKPIFRNHYHVRPFILYPNEHGTTAVSQESNTFVDHTIFHVVNRRDPADVHFVYMAKGYVGTLVMSMFTGPSLEYLPPNSVRHYIRLFSNVRVLGEISRFFVDSMPLDNRSTRVLFSAHMNTHDTHQRQTRQSTLAVTTDNSDAVARQRRQNTNHTSANRFESGAHAPEIAHVSDSIDNAEQKTRSGESPASSSTSSDADNALSSDDESSCFDSDSSSQSESSDLKNNAWNLLQRGEVGRKNLIRRVVNEEFVFFWDRFKRMHVGAHDQSTPRALYPQFGKWLVDNFILRDWVEIHPLLFYIITRQTFDANVQIQRYTVTSWPAVPTVRITPPGSTTVV